MTHCAAVDSFFRLSYSYNKKRKSLQSVKPFADVVDVSPRVDVRSRLLLEIVVLLRLVYVLRMRAMRYVASTNALSRKRINVHSR